MKILKGYELRMDEDQYAIVNRTLNLYHRLIAGPIFVEDAIPDVMLVSFEYWIWNEKRIDMMLTHLTEVCKVKMTVREL